MKFLLSSLTFSFVDKKKNIQIDAFTREAFKGNPAAVCLLEENADVDEQWMQSVAKEFNISDTAFLSPVISAVDSSGQYANSSIPRFNLRWFTPAAEVFLSDLFISYQVYNWVVVFEASWLLSIISLIFVNFAHMLMPCTHARCTFLRLQHGMSCQFVKTSF